MNKLDNKQSVALTIILGMAILIGILLWAGLPGNRTANLGNQAQLKQGYKATVTIVDCAGRSVKVPQKVQRIACLYAFSGHVVTMLGSGDRIIAVVDGLKRDKLLTQLEPSIERAAVPVSSGAINIEELISVRPEVAFVKSEVLQNAGEYEKLEKSGIPFLVVDYTNMQEQQYAITMIGKVIGAEKKAALFNQFYQSCIRQVNSQIAQIPVAKRTRIYHSVMEATRTDAKDSLSADWLQATGVIDVSVQEDLKLLEDKSYASLEQILLWDPEIILANEPGVANYILTNKQWATLRAVKSHKVYQMPNGISRWGHPGSLETPLAILWTGKTVYPQLFGDLNLREETKKFYRMFFNITLDDDMLANVLSGEGMRKIKGE